MAVAFGSLPMRVPFVTGYPDEHPHGVAKTEQKVLDSETFSQDPPIANAEVVSESEGTE